jgi:pilus assembly protein CpaC
MRSVPQLPSGGYPMSNNKTNIIHASSASGKSSLTAKMFPLLLAVAASFSASFAQTAQELKLTVGKSVVIDYPADIGRISTSNPEVVDYVAVTTREILLHAKGNGSATLIVWSKSGQREFYTVNVEANVEPIRKLLKDTFPNEDIRVLSARDSVSLVGKVSSKEVSDRAALLVGPLTKSVLNNLQISAGKVEKQILLRVKFAEINRNSGMSLGANLVSTGAGNTLARTTTGQNSAPSPTTIGGGTTPSFSITDALNIFAFRPDLNLGAFVKALQSKGVLQILAEPNLVTTNNKEASFLAGGEFPVPVLQGGGNAGAVTVQFREFGIRLSFTPQITENGTIKMYVKPEVSTIDIANGVTISGFTIPALSTRRMETNIELGEGQSFVIGGLIDNRVTESMSKIPGLAHIPLLGAIFKSRNDTRSNTELVVMVTPEITSPIGPSDVKPAISWPKNFMDLEKFDGPAKNKNKNSAPVKQPGDKSADAKKGSQS